MTSPRLPADRTAVNPTTCPWCASARQLGNPEPHHAQHETWRRELDTHLEETGRRTTRRLAADAAAWDAARAEAERRGACLDCLRKSDWHSHPRHVRHRRADIHPKGHS